MIYFDHNATTPIDSVVVEAMQPYLTTLYGNPSSLHRHGRAVKTAIEQARQQIAGLVNVSPNQVTFTSGGTEANNLALLGRSNAQLGEILLGATEHPSVNDPIKALTNNDLASQILAVDINGVISNKELSAKIKPSTELVSIMHANNETGVIQDIARLSAELASKKTIFHIDAVQSAGKIPVDFQALGVNLMSLSSHKIYGPKGVGALICDNKVQLNPLLYGGGQESCIRPGTENVAAIVGFGKAAELAKQQLASRSKHLQQLKNTLEAGIKQIVGLTIVAEGAQRLPNTSQILIDNIDGEMLLMQLDQKGIAVSSGSACSSNSKEPSPVLKAMGYPNNLALSAIRVSLGQQNTLDDVNKFIASLKQTLSA